MEDTLISVVVPIYNRQDTIKRTIDSLISQTYSNIEIILVDDGSSDKSLKICRSYSEKDNRIKVYHKENGGVSSARNYGISKSNGEYISFVDAGDFVESNLYESLIEYLGLDAIYFSYYVTNNLSEKFEVHNKIRENKKFDRKYIIDEILPCLLNLKENDNNYVLNFSVMILYKKSIINDYNLKYDENVKKWEDREFIMQYISKCNDGIFIDKCLYNYVCSTDESHLSLVYYPNLVFETIDHIKERKNFFSDLYSFNSPYYYNHLAKTFLNLCIDIINNEDKSNAINIIEQVRKDTAVCEIFRNWQVEDITLHEVKCSFLNSDIFELYDELNKYKIYMEKVKNKKTMKQRIKALLSKIKHKLKSKF